MPMTPKPIMLNFESVEVLEKKGSPRSLNKYYFQTASSPTSETSKRRVPAIPRGPSYKFFKNLNMGLILKKHEMVIW